MSGHADEDYTANDIQGANRTTQIPFVAGKMLDLYIENPNGDTDIRASDRADILVKWTMHGRPVPAVFDDADVVAVQEDDTKIAIKITLATILGGADFGRSVLKFLEGGIKGGNPFASFTSTRIGFDILVDVPRTWLEATPGKVRVRTANGDVDISNIVGTVDVATANGDLTLTSVRGEISLHAANGDLTLESPIGRVTARTVSGDLNLRGGDLTHFTLTTVNGGATIDTTLTGDASRLESVSGDVKLDLTVPASTGATLTARSVSGEANVLPPFRSVAKRTWRIGPGTDDGPSVAVKSVSGDLTARGSLSTVVTKSTDAIILTAPTAPEPPNPSLPPEAPVLTTSPISPPPPMPSTFRGRTIASTESTDQPEVADAPEDLRLAILRAVERGEIDIDEAMRRLDTRQEP